MSIKLEHDHSFAAPIKGDSRSPCPALNAMANRNYLPRDGRDISWWQLVQAQREVYNLSLPLAIFLATVAILFCGDWWNGRFTLDLHDLARHNVIEHDTSLTHDDAAPGAEYAPCRPDASLVHQLLDGPGAHITFHQFVEARCRRARQGRKPLDSVHKEIAHGEAALTMLVFGQHTHSADDTTLRVPRAALQAWFADSRLPDDWVRPQSTVSMRRAIGLSREIGRAILARDWIGMSA